jgi:hypothetical protein
LSFCGWLLLTVAPAIVIAVRGTRLPYGTQAALRTLDPQFGPGVASYWAAAPAPLIAALVSTTTFLPILAVTLAALSFRTHLLGARPGHPLQSGVHCLAVLSALALVTQIACAAGLALGGMELGATSGWLVRLTVGSSLGVCPYVAIGLLAARAVKRPARALMLAYVIGACLFVATQLFVQLGWPLWPLPSFAHRSALAPGWTNAAFGGIAALVWLVLSFAVLARSPRADLRSSTPASNDATAILAAGTPRG